MLKICFVFARLLSIAAALTLLISVTTHAQTARFVDDVDWKLRKDKHGVQVYVAKISGSKHRAVFSTMQITAEVESVVALLMDLPNCHEWAAMCKKARKVEQRSEMEYLVYGRNDLPFPLRDRDSFSVCKWSIDKDLGIVAMDCEAQTGDQYPINKGVVRLTDAHVVWRIIPDENGKLLIENYAHIDPNGVIPVWLTNALVVETPLSSMRKIRRLIENGRYDQENISFLKSRLDSNSSSSLNSNPNSNDFDK